MAPSNSKANILAKTLQVGIFWDKWKKKLESWKV